MENHSLGSKVRSSNILFFPTTRPKPKDIQFIIREEQEEQQISTFGTGTEAVAGDFFLIIQRSID